MKQIALLLTPLVPIAMPASATTALAILASLVMALALAMLVGLERIAMNAPLTTGGRPALPALALALAMMV